MAYIEHDLTYTTNYLLYGEEVRLFATLLAQDTKSPYKAFLLLLLKELDNDMSKFLRLIGTMSKTHGFTPKNLIKKVLNTIREVVIITDIENGKLRKTSISELSRSLRYESKDISRQMIHRTINKHDLKDKY